MEISLTQFRDEYGNPVSVYFVPGKETDKEPKTRITIQLDRDRTTLRLNAAALSLDRVYTGELWVKGPKESLKQFTVQLKTGKLIPFI